MTYPERLAAIGIEFVNPFTTAKEHQLLRCLQCTHEWIATPISKLQNFKKHGKTGCPICTNSEKYSAQRSAFLSKLEDIPHIDILSEYDGNQTFNGVEGTKVKFRNNICGHEFESYPNYIINQKTDCPVCGEEERVAQLSARNLANRFYDDPEQWLGYKSMVVSTTRKTYLAHKADINPLNLPIGKCGVEGAYQVDHIVSKAIGFKLGIPPELLSHPSNLQMLPWEENLAHKDKHKGVIPEVLKEFFADRG